MSLGQDLANAVWSITTDANLLRGIVQGPVSGPSSLVVLPNGAQIKTLARIAAEITGGYAPLAGATFTGSVQIGGIGAIQELMVGMTTSMARLRERNAADLMVISTNLNYWGAPDNVAKSSWLLGMGHGAGEDRLVLARMNPGGTGYNELFSVNGSGSLSVGKNTIGTSHSFRQGNDTLFSFASDVVNEIYFEAMQASNQANKYYLNFNKYGGGTRFAGTVHAPGVGTTAAAANTVLDSGSTPANQLLRSTSSLAYKKDVESLNPGVADSVIENARPIWYRSKAPADNPEWGFYGLLAEELAEVDPRLVIYGYQDQHYEEIDAISTVQVRVPNVLGPNGEPIYRDEQVTRKVRQLKADAQKVPDGIAYDRLSVMLLDVVRRERAARVAADARADSLEARVAALEAVPV